jgi:hypothetical protein
MSVEMANHPHEGSPATVVSGDVRCALTGRTVSAEEAYWAPPLISARELVGAIITNLVRTPSNLGHVLFEEQSNVPYHPDARDQLASRRTAEQLKLLLLLLVVAALIVVPIFMMAIA